MIVNVCTVFHLKEIMGENKIEVELPQNSSLLDLIDELCSRYGEAFYSALFDDASAKRLKPGLQLLVNGRNMRYLEHFHTKLRDGDEIVFLPFAAGG